MNEFRNLIVPILASASAILAQSPSESRSIEAGDWLIPIHTAPADPVGGAYGTWAAGPGYKVSFHDGFTFYPYLGAAYPKNLPLRWCTESIVVGDQSVVDASVAPETAWTEWRFEYRFDGVTEAYDVHAAGVEQSFIVHAPPAGAGDLVVTGRVATELSAARLEATHGPLRFCDAAGGAIVEYGAAVAFDAAGRRTNVTTGYDGDRVRLRVAGEWLRDARYPVTIDPLTSRVWLHGAPSSAGGEVLDSDVVLPVDRRKTDPHLTFVVHSRDFSGSDIDAYGQMMNHSLSNDIEIWTDLSASWDTIRPRCSHVGQEDLWVTVFEREFSAGNSSVRAYLHPRSNGMPNAGWTVFLATPSGRSRLRPDIGGSAGFNNSASTCLVVFEDRATGSTTGRVQGALFDPVARTFGSGFSLERSASAAVTQLRPSVITHAMGTMSFPWLVAWQERSTSDPNDDWDLYVNRVHVSGSRDQEALVGPHASSTTDAYSPIVSGDWGHYLIAYERGPRFVPTQVGYQRFDWERTAGAPTVFRERTLRRPLNYFGTVHAVAFDLNTQSHWAILYQNASGLLSYLRVGHTGGTTGSGIVHDFSSGVRAGGAGFSWRHEDFVFTYSDVDLFYPLYGRRLTYPNASATEYGTSCGSRIVASGEPYAGNGRFGIVLGLPSGLTTNGFLLAAAHSGSWGIPGAGSCRVLLDSATMFVADSEFNIFHNHFFAVPLPDDPVFIGDVYFQGVYLRPAANPVGIETTNGLDVKVR